MSSRYGAKGASSEKEQRDYYSMSFVSNAFDMRASTSARSRPDTRDVVITRRCKSAQVTGMLNLGGSAFAIDGTSGSKQDMCCYLRVTTFLTVYRTPSSCIAGAHDPVPKVLEKWGSSRVKRRNKNQTGQGSSSLATSKGHTCATPSNPTDSISNFREVRAACF